MLHIHLAALDTEEEQLKMADIYNQHKHAMLRYALKMAHNQELAEDAVHNAFLAVIKHKDKYFSLSGRDFRAAIVIIVKNKCIDLLRQGNVFVDDGLDDMDNLLECQNVPLEEQIIRNEEYEAFRKHVASLDEVSRLVIEMKYVREMSYKEIGAELDMTPKHVDTKIMRAKEKIRKLVAMGGEPVER